MERRNQNGSARQLAVGLGWFSVALGAAELIAPRRVTRLIGASPTRTTVAALRGYGARDIASGLTILAQPDQARWVWARVGGDAMDLSGLAALQTRGASRTRATAAAAALLGITALDILCARRLGRQATGTHQRPGFRVVEATTIKRSIDDVYGFWRELKNLPRFMRHLESVELLGEGRSRWRAKGPAGTRVEWEAETTEDRRNELIAWRSLPGSQVDSSGTVRFQRAPAGRGTEVRVDLEYNPPAGAIGRQIAWLFGEEPAQQIHEDLHRFKQLMETGEIAVSDGPGLWRAAQPAADARDIRSLAGVQS